MGWRNDSKAPEASTSAWFCVWVLEFEVWGLEFEVWGSGFGIWGLGEEEQVGAHDEQEEVEVQGYLAHEKRSPHRTLQ